VTVMFSATRVSEADVDAETEVELTSREDELTETRSMVSTLAVCRRGGKGGGTITVRVRGGKGGGLVNDPAGPVNDSSIKS
jgi:hypothetical protein